MADIEPILVFVAGVNGAGKSTVFSTNTGNYFNLHKIPYINPDTLLRQMGGDWKNENDQIKAAKAAILKRNQFFEKKESFAIETTLSGYSNFKIATQAKKLGYKVQMYYVGLDSAEIAIERVKNRVEMGGHGIDEDLIRKRYSSSQENFLKFISICDNIKVFDNTTLELKKIAKITNGKIEIISNVQWFDNLVNKKIRFASVTDEQYAELQKSGISFEAQPNVEGGKIIKYAATDDQNIKNIVSSLEGNKPTPKR